MAAIWDLSSDIVSHSIAMLTLIAFIFSLIWFHLGRYRIDLPVRIVIAVLSLSATIYLLFTLADYVLIVDL